MDPCTSDRDPCVDLSSVSCCILSGTMMKSHDSFSTSVSFTYSSSPCFNLSFGGLVQFLGNTGGQCWLPTCWLSHNCWWAHIRAVACLGDGTGVDYRIQAM
jgi:hypothetical protein